MSWLPSRFSQASPVPDRELSGLPNGGRRKTPPAARNGHEAAL